MPPRQSTDPESSRHETVLREEADIAHEFARVTTPAERRRAFSVLFVSLVCMGAGQTVLFNVQYFRGVRSGLGGQLDLLGA